MKNNIKALVLNREAVLTVAFVGAAMMAPLAHSQLIAGTIVNAALFGAAMAVGFRAAAMVAVIPSLIALAVGTLPLAMAPMIPFIMVSNIALAGVFVMLKKTNYWLAAGAAILAKFGLLVFGASMILSAMAHGNIGIALASAMGWPQLITASLGAALAYAVFERRTGKIM